MLARSAAIRAFTRRDGARLLIFGLLLVVALGTVLSIDVFTDPFGGRLPRVGGWFLLAALVVMLLFGWLWRFRPQIWNRPNAVLLIALIVLGATLALKITGGR